MYLKEQKINFTVNDCDLKISFAGDTLKFSIQDLVKVQFYQFNLTPDIFLELPLSYYFEKPSEVFDYFKNPFKLNISKNGVIEFEIAIQNKMKKLTIETIKKQVDKNQIIRQQRQEIDRKDAKIKQLKQINQNLLKQLEMLKGQGMKIKENKELQSLQIQNKDLKEKNNLSPPKVIKSQQKQSINIQNCEILKSSSNKFSLDNNDYSEFFTIDGNKIKRTGKNGQWSFIYGKEIEKQSVFSYKVNQILTINSCIFYGVGSNQIRVKKGNSPYTSNYFVGYWAHVGTITSSGVNKTSSSIPIKNGQTVEVVVDSKNWKISFWSDKVELGKAELPHQLKGQSLFPIIMMAVENDVIQLI